jgi:hypothetical protein
MIDNNILNQLYSNKKQQISAYVDKMPSQVLPVVTQSDATSGFIIRYFVKQVNDNSHIVEVDKQQYEKFKSNPRFVTTSIDWKIIGKKNTVTLLNGVNLHGVSDMNRIEVANEDLTFGGLRVYIKDYLEYWVSEE